MGVPPRNLKGLTGEGGAGVPKPAAPPAAAPPAAPPWARNRTAPTRASGGVPAGQMEGPGGTYGGSMAPKGGGSGYAANNMGGAAGNMGALGAKFGGMINSTCTARIAKIVHEGAGSSAILDTVTLPIDPSEVDAFKPGMEVEVHLVPRHQAPEVEPAVEEVADDGSDDAVEGKPGTIGMDMMRSMKRKDRAKG